jgi:two-component system, chemotaxis family, sensor kinase CheA
LSKQKKHPIFQKKSKVENKKENTDATAVLIKRGDGIAGLVIDKLAGEQEIVVKPLAPILRGAKGFSGSTILGDGSTILIIDTGGLIDGIKKTN